MFELNEEQQMIIDSVRKIAENELAPRAAALDEEGGFPEHAHKIFAENGILNPLLPEEFGGIGASFFTFSLILAELARVCASSALLLIAQADGMLPILHGASPELKQKYLGRLEADSLQLTALAATEPGAGSDLMSMKTRAVLKGDRYLVNGQKCFITDGSVADFFTLYAYTDPEAKSRGISAFVVEKKRLSRTFLRQKRKQDGHARFDQFNPYLRRPGNTGRKPDRPGRGGL